MENKIESFICLLMKTEYLNNLLFKNSEKVDEYTDVINILENWERFKCIDDIKKMNNKHINKAIEEFENNKQLTKIWKEDF